jgi:predicted phage terminase large subunit-like protein
MDDAPLDRAASGHSPEHVTSLPPTPSDDRGGGRQLSREPALQDQRSGSAASLRPDQIQALIGFARADLWCFVELMFEVLFPRTKLVYAPYLELIATLLMRVEQGKWRNLIINLPPRHMKSALASILYPAWRLGRDPTIKFICISYGDDLAHELSSLTRKIMRSELYRRIFPNTILDKSAVDHIRTTQGGYRYATDAEGKDRLYLTGIVRIQVEIPEVREAMIGQGKLDQPALILMDGNGVGRGVYQDLWARGFRHVLPGESITTSATDNLKLRRFNEALFYLYDGFVQLPKSMLGLDALFDEMAAFPAGKHDDQVDALSTVAAYFPRVVSEARRLGRQYSRLTEPATHRAPPPPKSRDQELHERRQWREMQ